MIRTYNILRQLSSRFQVTVLCFYREAHVTGATELREALAVLRQFGHVESFPIPADNRPTRQLWDLARGGLTSRPYTFYLHQDRDYRRRLIEILDHGDMDLVHMDSLDLCAYLPILTHLPVACTHHNVESHLLGQRAVAEKSFLRSAYMKQQARHLAEVERYWCERVALNVTVSRQDRARLERMVSRGRFLVVPNGVDTANFSPQSGCNRGLVFVGGSTWFPNRDALNYFCREILPLVRGQDVHDIPVRWIGDASPADRESYGREFGVDLTGRVPDIRPFVHDAACFVVPLRVGGGTRLKILDAWSMGKAVVSTSIGCEGLEAIHGHNILIADTPEAFAGSVRAILADKELRDSLGKSGRRTVERLYTWDGIGREMIECYLALAGRVPSPRTSQRRASTRSQ